MNADGGRDEAKESDGGAVNVSSKVVSSVASKDVLSVTAVPGRSVCVSGRPRSVFSLGNLCPDGVQERREGDVAREGVLDVDGGIHDDGRRNQRMSASSCDENSRNLDVRSRDRRACMKLQSKILLFERIEQRGKLTEDKTEGDLTD